MTPVTNPAQGMHGLAPHLTVAGAADAIAFYKRAFGAEEMVRLPAPDGKLPHASVRINGCMVMLVDEMPDAGVFGPKALKGAPVHMHLSVTDAHAVAARAIAAGATLRMPVERQFWGDVYGMVEDPFGHVWAIATPAATVMSEDELVAASRQAMAERKGDPMKITVEKFIRAPLAKVWSAYVTPADIVQWNAASDDWHTTRATVDLRVGGAFSSRMEARDGSFGFDFAGTYTKVEPEKRLEYDFGDRKAAIDFLPAGDGVTVRIAFDPETQNPVEMQRQGWQAILDNFARHVEARA